jgi:proline iminopeptidase
MRKLWLTLMLVTVLVFPLYGQTQSNVSQQTENEAAASNHPPGYYVTAAAARLWLESEGSGEPLLLISGGPGFSHSYFHPYFSALAKSNRVIYLDSYGRGKSDRAKEPEKYTFNRDVTDIEEIRKALGVKKISVLGHSYGGLVAIAYALRFPESVHKLILVDTLFSAEMWQANNDNWNLQIRNQFPEVWEKLTTMRNAGVHSCTREYQDIEGTIPLGLFYFYDASTADKFMKNLEPQSLDVYCALAGDDADVLIGGDIAKLDFRKGLASLQMPVLILSGRFDRLAMPHFSLQFKRYAPQAKFVMFERSGHLPFVEEPEGAFQEMTAFLSGVIH